MGGGYQDGPKLRRTQGRGVVWTADHCSRLPRAGETAQADGEQGGPWGVVLRPSARPLPRSAWGGPGSWSQLQCYLGPAGNAADRRPPPKIRPPLCWLEFTCEGTDVTSSWCSDKVGGDPQLMESTGQWPRRAPREAVHQPSPRLLVSCLSLSGGPGCPQLKQCPGLKALGPLSGSESGCRLLGSDPGIPIHKSGMGPGSLHLHMCTHTYTYPHTYISDSGKLV